MNGENKNLKAARKTAQAGDTAVIEEQPKKIMVMPLPQILDEIDNSIREADAAAKNARDAAEEARRAGEKAANEAARVAAEAISKVEKVAKDALALAELLNSTMTEVAVTVEKRLVGKK